jgi:hypothetical protein
MAIMTAFAGEKTVRRGNSNACKNEMTKSIWLLKIFALQLRSHGTGRRSSACAIGASGTIRRPMILDGLSATSCGRSPSRGSVYGKCFKTSVLVVSRQASATWYEKERFYRTMGFVAQSVVRLYCW